MEILIKLNYAELKTVVDNGLLIELCESISKKTETVEKVEKPIKHIVEGMEFKEENIETPWDIPKKEEKKPAATEDQIRAKFVELNKSGKKAELKALLNEFGVVKVTELTADKFDEVYARLEAL